MEQAEANQGLQAWFIPEGEAGNLIDDIDDLLNDDMAQYKSILKTEHLGASDAVTMSQWFCSTEDNEEQRTSLEVFARRYKNALPHQEPYIRFSINFEDNELFAILDRQGALHLTRFLQRFLQISAADYNEEGV